jgi:hypothetical protein
MTIMGMKPFSLFVFNITTFYFNSCRQVASRFSGL